MEKLLSKLAPYLYLTIFIASFVMFLDNYNLLEKKHFDAKFCRG